MVCGTVGQSPGHFIEACRRAGGTNVLSIVHYPHPALAHGSKPLRRVDAELRGMIREMFDLMYGAQGIGLAANQVALPYRLFVLNLTGSAEHPDQEWVFLNPVISQRKGSGEAEEGCLSLPSLYAQVRRPEAITIEAYGLDGREIKLSVDGLFARAAQHELDHLDGVLFIDRLTPAARAEIQDEVEEFEIEFAARRARGEVPGDREIAQELRRLESLRT